MADSATTSEPQQPTPASDTQPTPETLTQRMARLWAGLRLAHETAMVEDAREVLRINRQSVEAAHRQHQATFLPDGRASEEADDVGDLHVGDVVQYYQTPQPAAAPSPQTSGVSKAALVAAALGAGGLGAAVPLAVDALREDRPAVVQQIEDQDTDTQYQLRLSAEP